MTTLLVHPHFHSAMSTAGFDSSSPESEVESLLCLINSATQDALAIYKNSGRGIPSIHSTNVDPFDKEATSLALKKAIRVLEGSCEQLCATLAPPSHTLLNVTCPIFLIFPSANMSSYSYLWYNSDPHVYASLFKEGSPTSSFTIHKVSPSPKLPRRPEWTPGSFAAFSVHSLRDTVFAKVRNPFSTS